MTAVATRAEIAVARSTGSHGGAGTRGPPASGISARSVRVRRMLMAPVPASSGQHLELAHHVVVLMGPVVAVEDEPSREVPELVDQLDLLIRTQPHHVLEALEFSGARSAPLDLGDAETAEMDVHRVAPAAAGVEQRPLLAGVEDREVIHSGRVPPPP